MELIFLIIFTFSLLIIGVLIFQKIPLLLELSPTHSTHFSWREVISKTKNSAPLKKFSFEIYLQKILSRIRVLTLRTDSKTSNLLQKLREREQKKKFDENDNYWQEIRRSTRKK